ncbi:MAG: N-acetyltransferase family protein [Planctomycetia bacterium]|nr:N-acetyltransferase family protein [Planctomycetia bacterium]
MDLITCREELHATAILDILNDAIVNSTAIYEYHARTIDSMPAWFRAKRDGRYPVIGAIGGSNELAGFATFGPFRAFPAYKYTVEHSVYVHRDHRGRGIGSALLRQLITAAGDQQYHVMVGVVDAANAASIGLHERAGFTRSGTIQQAGFKFGRWLDAALYQIILPTPGLPKDG